MSLTVCHIAIFYLLTVSYQTERYSQGETMTLQKDVYYISGTTGILAKEMGKALLRQFPDIQFSEELIPFIRTVADAQKACDRILEKSGSQSPIIISTLFSEELNRIFDIDGVEYFDICNHFLVRLEQIANKKALRKPGGSRIQDDMTMSRRVNAIQYSIGHDDGTDPKGYDEADIILVGVSRSGKTPVSIFLATQMGMKAANYPLVDQDLEKCQLPEEILRNKEKVVGLSTTSKLLHSFRQKRFKNSNYASLSTCESELASSHCIFNTHNIPVVTSAGNSIEEMATQAAQIVNPQQPVL